MPLSKKRLKSKAKSGPGPRFAAALRRQSESTLKLGRACEFAKAWPGATVCTARATERHEGAEAPCPDCGEWIGSYYLCETHHRVLDTAFETVSRASLAGMARWMAYELGFGHYYEDNPGMEDLINLEDDTMLGQSANTNHDKSA